MVMKLYAFQPNGHGQYSFFVAAASEEEARNAVADHIALHKGKVDGHHIGGYEVEGWGTDYYVLTVLNPNEVISNCND